MSVGMRKALQAQYIYPYAGATAEFLVDDEPRSIKRIKLYNNTNKIVAVTDVFRIEAEGENLYSGLNLPIVSTFYPTEHVHDIAETQKGPYVLEFDEPIEISREHSLKVYLNTSTENDWWYVIIEGI